MSMEIHSRVVEQLKKKDKLTRANNKEFIKECMINFVNILIHSSKRERELDYWTSVKEYINEKY
jgi:hypothetical protein